MKRLAALLTAVVLVTASGHVGIGSPVSGQKRVGSDIKIEPKAAFEFTEKFRGGERACVIVRGDHKSEVRGDPDSEVDLGVHVFDQHSNPVIKVENSGDLVSAIWYPARDAVYKIKIVNPGPTTNNCYISLK